MKKYVSEEAQGSGLSLLRVKISETRNGLSPLAHWTHKETHSKLHPGAHKKVIKIEISQRNLNTLSEGNSDPQGYYGTLIRAEPFCREKEIWTNPTFLSITQ